MKLLSVVAIFLLTACATRGHDMSRNLLDGNEAALRGDYSTAVLRYESALKAVPDSKTAKRNLGIVLVKVGNYPRARDLLLSIEKSFENDVDLHYHLGEAFRGLTDYGNAVFYYQKALKVDAKDLRVIKAVAWTWHKMRYYEKTLATLTPVLEKSPNDLQIRLIMASTYNKLKQFQKTLSVLDVVEKSGLKIKSKDKVTAESERALILSTLAEAYFGLNNYGKATAIYNEVLKARPFLATALVGGARCDLASNNVAKAQQKLMRAVKSDPDSADAHYLLARTYQNSDANKSTFYFKRFLLLSKYDVDYVNEVNATKNALAELEKRQTNR